MNFYYQYDAESGVYLGPVPSSGKPNALPPVNTTTTKPEDREGFCPVWKGLAWQYIEDHRGQTIWMKDLSVAAVMSTLGPVPEGYTAKMPPALQAGQVIRWDEEAGDWELYDIGETVTLWRKDGGGPVALAKTDPIPGELTAAAPLEPKNGFVVSWDEAKGKWVYIEDHRGEGGFVDGVWTVIADLGPLPKRWSPEKPALRDGYVIEWNKKKKAWEYIEDHRGKGGYVNGEYVTIANIGPLPDGWSDTPPPVVLTLDEAKAEKKFAIDATTNRIRDRDGLAYAGERFSMSDKAMLKWTGLLSAKDMLTYPVTILTIDEQTFELGDQTALLKFAAAVLGYETAPDSPLSTGRVLRQRVEAAESIEEVEAIVDDRD